MVRNPHSGRSGGATGPVAARVLHTLSAFSQQHSSLSLSEIARRTNTPVATTHRYLKELEDWGALTRDESGVYRIGLRLWKIGMLCTQTAGLRETALPYLEDLAQLTRENVQLAVWEDGDVVFVERLAGSTAVPVLTKVGGNSPTATSTSAGLLLLAHAPQIVQDEVLSKPIRKFTEKTLTDVAVIRREFAQIRNQGFSISDRQVTMETISVSAPIHSSSGSVIAALSLVVAYESAHVHSLTPLVRTSAKAISRALAGART